MADGLATGRTPSRLESPWTGVDAVFGSQRVDEGQIARASYKHSTFVNVSFKGCVLHDSTFFDCTFIDCYFRNAVLRGCSFVGCRFIDCQFPKVEMSNCDLRYARFDNCVLDPGEAHTNLPREPNLREELTTRLAVAAEGQGRSAIARTYRLWAIEARQQHLAAAVRGENSWYREHFSGIDRLLAGVRWLASRGNGQLWGHGEKWHVLARNLLGMTFVLFPVLFWMASDGLQKASGTPGFADYVAVSVASVIPSADVSTVELASWTTRVIAGSAAFTGLVAAGLFVTILFRAVTRR